MPTTQEQIDEAITVAEELCHKLECLFPDLPGAEDDDPVILDPNCKAAHLVGACRLIMDTLSMMSADDYGDAPGHDVPSPEQCERMAKRLAAKA